MSDAPLTDCPACQTASLKKQLTAAAFKLKGTGWYETDFKNSGKKPADKTEAKSDASTKVAKKETSSESTASSKSDVA